ncbi:potassium channel family protein [Microvirga yunnanensis]|nr:potassium channel family protein [Microvirga sp. HBU65207]
MLDSAHFAVVTIATIGDGDPVPRTAAGKLFTTA